MPDDIQQRAPGRAVAVVHDALPIMDSGRFEHMQRIATAIATSSLVPQHLKGGTAQEALANCFRVVNQAVRWGFDPFAVIDETYVVGQKLGFQGKLIAAVVNAKAGLKERLAYSYNGKPGDDLEITVSGTFQGESEARTVVVRVGTAKTSNKMWAADPRQKLIYTGATKWARAYCPELLLGILTDDDVDRMQEMGALVPGADGTYADAPPRPTREQFQVEAHETPPEPFVLIDSDGVERTFDDPRDAAKEFLILIGQASDSDGLTGLWESNPLSGELRNRGHADLADKLRTTYDAALASFVNDKASDATDAALPAEPETPKQFGATFMTAYTDGFVAWVGDARTQDETIRFHQKRNEKTLSYIRANFAKLQERIDVALDLRRSPA